ncbi:MAG: hypothetical protein LBM12_02565 [Candidatus Nomurabacteria bacterium]|jgi:tRNA A37 threonylcarbamoyladenosine modification protein TsaB|nr:hypothetical protein [Candidatus Nomurabacteria bacterium]
MILYIDTLTSVAKIWLDELPFEREMGRQMSDELMGFVLEKLNRLVPDGIVIHNDKGSFTGARLGAVLANTLAEVWDVPIVAADGEDWRSLGDARLFVGENDGMVKPTYE